MDADGTARSALAVGILAAVVLLVALAAGLLLSAGATAMRQAYEPLSAAEYRCRSVYPANGVDSVAWSGCIERESGESPIAAATPQLVWTGAILACAILVGVASTLTFDRSSAS